MSFSIIRMDDELYHYGVKGMRWGVRKQPEHVRSEKANRLGQKYENKFNKMLSRAKSINNLDDQNKYYSKKKARIQKKLIRDVLNKGYSLKEVSGNYKYREVSNMIQTFNMDKLTVNQLHTLYPELDNELKNRTK